MKKSLLPIALFLGIFTVSCETEPIVDEISTESLKVITRLSDDKQPVVPYFTLENKRTNKKVTYTFQNSEWKTDGESFLLKDLNKNDKFLAEYEPLVSNSISNVKDILQAESTYNGGGEIELNFTHVNASFVLKIINNTEQTYKNISVNLWDEFNIEDFKDKQIIIIIPKTIEKGSIIKINADDVIFSHEIGKNLVLEKNKEISYEINLTNDLSFNVQEKEWEVTNEKGVDIIVPSISGVQLPGDGQFSFTIKNDKTGDKKNFLFDYIHEKKELSGILTDVDKPFRWDMFPEEDTYTISGEFIPNMKGNPEKDILQGVINIKWGKPINFNNFNHINSKIEIVLDIDEKSFNNSNNYIVFNGLNFDNSSQEYKIKLQKTIEVTIIPQIINDEATIKLVVDGEEYVSIINTIKSDGVNLSEFKAGNKYVFTYTIHSYDNDFISYTITDWNTVNGTGEFLKN